MKGCTITKQCNAQRTELRNGIEEWREGKKQEWEETRFVDAGQMKLEKAAPQLLEALRQPAVMRSVCEPNHHNLDVLHLGCCSKCGGTKFKQTDA